MASLLSWVTGYLTTDVKELATPVSASASAGVSDDRGLDAIIDDVATHEIANYIRLVENCFLGVFDCYVTLKGSVLDLSLIEEKKSRYKTALGRVLTRACHESKSQIFDVYKANFTAEQIRVYQGLLTDPETNDVLKTRADQLCLAVLKIELQLKGVLKAVESGGESVLPGTSVTSVSITPLKGSIIIPELFKKLILEDKINEIIGCEVGLYRRSFDRTKTHIASIMAACVLYRNEATKMYKEKLTSLQIDRYHRLIHDPMILEIFRIRFEKLRPCTENITLAIQRAALEALSMEFS